MDDRIALSEKTMKLHVLFSLNNARKTGVMSSYRPDWTSELKPEHNGGVLSFTDKQIIMPGESHECILEPLVPEFWSRIRLNDVLECMEGSRQVGQALVLEITSYTKK